MKNSIILFAALCLTIICRASTNITTPTASGHWTLAGAPYLVFNDIQVNDSLIIDPGVEVIFKGAYKITVVGTMRAEGTAAQRISFHRDDTTGWSSATALVGGWNGILVLFGGTTSLSDSMTFRYCDVSDMKGGNIAGTNDRSPFDIKYCNFSHNKGGVIHIYPGLTYNSTVVNVVHNNFYENSAPIGSAFIELIQGTFNFLDNTVYENSTNCALLAMKSDLVMTGNSFYGNVQPDSQNTSLVFVNQSRATISANKIYENTSFMVAPLSSYQSAVDINGNYICNNRVLVAYNGTVACGLVQGGAAIRLENYGDPVYHMNIVRNNIIANNYNAFYGSALYILGSNVRIFNNQIVNNYGADAAYGAAIFINDNTTVGGTYVGIKNNLFYHNVASNGTVSDTASISVMTADTLEFNHNFMQEILSADLAASLSSISYLGDTGNNIISPVAQMINPTLTVSYTESALAADFHLQPSSVCINAGDTINASPSLYDYWGNVRFSGSRVDIGSHEYASTTATANNSIAQHRMRLYPNPARGAVSVVTTAVKGHVLVSDISGKVIQEVSVSSETTLLDTHSLSPGVYFASWLVEGVVVNVEKFITD